MLSAACRWALVQILLLSSAPAALKQIHLVERSDVAGYRYERILAKAHFAIDPALPVNRIIRDLDYAPRNSQGLVEFSADLFVLKPRNPAEGNGTLLFEVSNRGNKGLLSMFNFARATRDPRSAEDFGDGYLFKQGYTLVWLGWQADVPEEAHALRLFAPVATNLGKPIRGLVRAQWIVDSKTYVHNLGDRNHIPYPVADPNDPSLELTVQDHRGAPKRTIPRNQWQLARLEPARAVPDAGKVYLPSGFEPGKIYELVYTAEDPTVVGLGPAAIRDLISFLKYERNGTVLLGEQANHLKRALGFGTSQSGRFLRTFLYFGFNKDEKGRKVFDGVWAHVAGAGRGSFNHRFAQPSRDGHPYMNTLYPTDIFPFSDTAQTDPETGLTDGLLRRAEEDQVAPKIFYTNGSYEYWGRSASLIHTTLDGQADFPLRKETRIYLLSGTQHGPGVFPPQRSVTQHLTNPNDYRFVMRALLAAMNAWLKEGKEPPPSAYPRIDRSELVPLARVQFPKLPGVVVPKYPQLAYRVDYGEEFRTKGLVTKEPPLVGKPFPTLFPQVDADGNEKAGVRLPEIQVPLATYAGWNLRAPEIGAPEEIYSMIGSFFPFAKNKAERQKRGDPRPSIAERYPSREAYLAKIRQAAAGLVRSGYVLETDVPLLEQRAARMWDALAK
ncbi:MAG: alpha/beta hydrolase domain-containing protein [Bryobacteraceae bacterium]|nr:alpha/beta hydrolase domain-containing protein [Bryobacteraceae bacterium]MDW8377056.1 alpha/beta hydrolase domain-containing protein [Bryobacterales bacterium]